MTAPKKKPSGAGAGIAGAGGGTSLLGAANLLPDEYGVLRSFLIYVSPAASIIISYFWLIVASMISKKIRDVQMNSAIKKARKICGDVSSNSSASTTHKKMVQDNLEKLELLALEVIAEDAANVRATLT